MAPITDDTIAGLKSTIGQLEARIGDLENRLLGNESKPKSVSEQMRLILMGPPGAGMRRELTNDVPGARSNTT
jgi:adenylate kinase